MVVQIVIHYKDHQQYQTVNMKVNKDTLKNIEKLKIYLSTKENVENKDNKDKKYICNK